MSADVASSTLDRVLGCAAIALNAGTAGVVFVWPLYQPMLSSRLKLTGAQTQLIAVGCTLGQYGFGTWLGDIADRRGPAINSLIAAVLFAGSYAAMALAFAYNAGGWPFFALARLVSGVATASSYFAAMAASHRAFPGHPGLSIAVPCSIFGLSPLILSYVVAHIFRRGDSVAVLPMLVATAIAMGLVNLFGAFGMSRIVPMKLHPPAISAIDESAPLLPIKSDPPPTSLRAFLTDPAMWLLGLILFLATGPGDAVLATFGLIVEALDEPSTNALDVRGSAVIVLSLTNTVARLVVGALTDRVSPRWIGRPSVLALASAMLAVIWWWASTAMRSSDQLLWVAALTGVGYGVAFIMTPTIISQVWGASSLTRNYGSIAYFAAGGASIYTLVFGLVADAHSSTPPFCTGRACFALSFQLSAVGALIAAVLALVLAHRWRGQV